MSRLRDAHATIAGIWTDRMDEHHTRLQPVALTDPVLDPSLYYMVRRRDHVSPALPVENGGAVLQAGETLILDSLFNAFFERHWVEFTTVRRVRFAIRVTGAVRVEIRRRSPWAEQAIVLSSAIVRGEDAQAGIDVELDAMSVLQLGRLFVDVTCLEGSSVLHEACWTTPQAPLQDVSVHVAVCTFNKPAATLKNIAAVLSVLPGLPDVKRIHVVDQGEDRIVRHPDFARRDIDLFHRYVDVIEQDNFGGTGGFVRGMMAAKAAGATHILLLDDDIVIDPRVLERLVAVLKYSETPQVVGGHMLDLYHPSRLFSHAEVFDFRFGGSVRLEPHDLDCSQPRNLDKLLEPRVGSYNAWWFCCIPAEFLDKYALPLPFFIRSDDAEYGTRLTLAGEGLVQMPGLAIWHEPFYAKSSAWMAFYSFRNDLILASLRLPSIVESRRRVWRTFWWAISSYKYDLAAAYCYALESFVSGPDKVFGDIRANHRALFAELKPRAPEVQPFGGVHFIDAKPKDRYHKALPGWTRRLLSAYWNYVVPTRPGRSAQRILLPEHHYADIVYGDSAVAVLDRHANKVVVYRRDRRAAWELTLRFRRAVRAWMRIAPKLGDDYRAAVPVVSRPEAWRRQFGLGHNENGGQPAAVTSKRVA